VLYFILCDMLLLCIVLHCIVLYVLYFLSCIVAHCHRVLTNFQLIILIIVIIIIKSEA
jgi:hypothetical protein